MGIHQRSDAIRAAINEELKQAFDKFGADDDEKRDADADHPGYVYEALEKLGARSDILSIVGSLDDMMDEAWVLRELHRWNTQEP